MRVPVHYGGESAELEVSPDRLVAIEAHSPPSPIADVSDAVARAIDSPIAFPPLRRAVVPGDHVAIVLDAGAARPMEILGPIIECLMECRVQPRDICIVEASLGATPRDLLPDGLPPGIRLVPHDANDRKKLSYLATTKLGTRVYLNREVVDADLVVLVGPVAFHPILGHQGTSSSIFPGVADEAAREAFRARINGPRGAAARRAARAEADEAAWLLGAQFAAQWVAGAHGEPVAVKAGHWPDVQREAERMLAKHWTCQAARPADLVIAAVSVPAEHQTFEHVGAALDAATRLVSGGGRVVLLSAVACEFGPTLRAAAQFQDAAKVLDYLRKHPLSDCISTWQIARASLHARVCLLSRLADDLVEDLGMTPIAKVAEVQRLVDQAPSCLVLNDAQLAHGAVEREDEQPGS
jgi:nickel-dependent lactate racemase